MSINKGTTKVRPFRRCSEHGVLCTCPKSFIADNQRPAKRKRYAKKK